MRHRRRGCNGERASGFPLPRLCGSGVQNRRFCTTRTHLAVILSARFTKTGTMLRLRKEFAKAASCARMDGVAETSGFAAAGSF